MHVLNFIATESTDKTSNCRFGVYADVGVRQSPSPRRLPAVSKQELIEAKLSLIFLIGLARRPATELQTILVDGACARSVLGDLFQSWFAAAIEIGSKPTLS